jgi:uncharacterized delta-60 repeat protein
MQSAQILFLAFMFTVCVRGQPQALDSSFATIQLALRDGRTNHSSISEMILQPDGKILIRGGFGQVNGVFRSGVARLNADGTLDTTFVPPILSSDNPETMALQSDGKVIVGLFDSLNGEPNILRLNPDGTTDETFQPIRFFGARAISIGVDQSIYVAGSSGNLGDRAQKYLARYFSDGRFDSNYFPKVSGFPMVAESGLVTMTKQPDEKVILAGYFGTEPSSLNGFVRFNTDGSLDSTFTNAGPVIAYCQVVRVLPDGRILAGGPKTRRRTPEENAELYATLYRYLPDRSPDPEFKFNEFIPGFVKDIALQPNGKVFVAGHFTDSIVRWNTHIIRLNTDGTIDPTFSVEEMMPATFGDSIESVVLQPDGKILLSGSFTYGLGTPLARKYIVRLRGDPAFLTQTSLDPTLGARFKWSVLDTNLLYTVQSSTNLQTWTTHAEFPVGSPMIEAAVNTQQAPQTFLRLIH